MPVRAKPDSRPRLEGVRYINTRQAAHSYSIPPSPYTSLTHTAHTYQFPSSPWASALNRYMVSALESRVGWTSARKERTNEQLTNLDTQTYWQQPNNTDTQTTADQHWHRHTDNSRPTQTHWQQPTNTDDTRVGICVLPTVNYLQYLATGSTLMAVRPSQSPAPQPGTLSRILSGTPPSVQTVSDVC